MFELRIRLITKLKAGSITVLRSFQKMSIQLQNGQSFERFSVSRGISYKPLVVTQSRYASAPVDDPHLDDQRFTDWRVL